jgi:hypothetical protein
VTARLAPLVLVGLVAGPAGAQRKAEHELRTGGDVTVKPGEKGQASLTLVPLGGLTVHPSAPLRVSLAVEPEGGLSLPRRRLRRRDAADPRADVPRFDLPFASTALQGTFRLVADVRFWLCARRTCWPVRDRAVINVQVGAPPAGSGSSTTPAPSSGPPASP